jgi:hypothetical protein
MAGRPRNDVIDDNVVGIYHCWTRCVRRAFLCGEDPLTHGNFDHRKGWIYERLETLVRIFAVEACVSAVLSNHYHLIVRNRPDLADAWSDEEVVRRWWQLCPERRDEHGQPAEPMPVELRSICADAKRVGQLRRRLRSISWFMKSLNEEIAKRANAEESQKGHFWQERFGCRSLLDVAAVLACAVYVDLNEIRAELARTPEQSHNTSAYRRIVGRLLRRERARLQQTAESQQRATLPAAPGPVPDATETELDAEDPDFWLCPIDEASRAPLLGPGPVDRDASCEPHSSSPAHKQWRHGFLPLTLDQYLEVLDWTGRQWTSGKRGAIDADLPPILERLGLRASGWLRLVEQFDQRARRAVGSPSSLIEEALRRGRRWLHGIALARDCFS